MFRENRLAHVELGLGFGQHSSTENVEAQAEAERIEEDPITQYFQELEAADFTLTIDDQEVEVFEVVEGLYAYEQDGELVHAIIRGDRLDDVQQLNDDVYYDTTNGVMDKIYRVDGIELVELELETSDPPENLELDYLNSLQNFQMDGDIYKLTPELELIDHLVDALGQEVTINEDGDFIVDDPEDNSASVSSWENYEGSLVAVPAGYDFFLVERVQGEPLVPEFHEPGWIFNQEEGPEQFASR